MKFETKSAAQVMRRALKDMGGLTAADAENVVFHMTDWERDLAEYVAFLRAPNNYKHDEITALLVRFLVHVPEHVRLAAASLLKFEDTTDKPSGSKATRTKRKKAA